MKRQKWTLLFACTTVFILFSANLTWATIEYTCLTGKSYSFCHENPHGAGILTAEGEAYRQAGYILTADFLPSAWGPMFRLIMGFFHILASIIWFGTVFLYPSFRQTSIFNMKCLWIIGWRHFKGHSI